MLQMQKQVDDGCKNSEIHIQVLSKPRKKEKNEKWDMCGMTLGSQLQVVPFW